MSYRSSSFALTTSGHRFQHKGMRTPRKGGKVQKGACLFFYLPKRVVRRERERHKIHSFRWVRGGVCVGWGGEAGANQGRPPRKTRLPHGVCVLQTAKEQENEEIGAGRGKEGGGERGKEESEREKRERRGEEDRTRRARHAEKKQTHIAQRCKKRDPHQSLTKMGLRESRRKKKYPILPNERGTPMHLSLAQWGHSHIQAVVDSKYAAKKQSGCLAIPKRST